MRNNYPPDKRTEMPDRMKRARPNRMRQVQVLPPHNVDLTLPSVVTDDIHVPAHVDGSDLSKGGPCGTSTRDQGAKPTAKPGR